MKAITYLALCATGIAVMTTSALAETAKIGWSTNLDEALVKAKIEKKPVLVEFTGSDWCPPCIAMRKNVFTKKEFVEAASKKFILVELDFPKGDEKISKQNEPFAEKFKIEAFPTVVLLDFEGKEFTRFMASEHPTVEAFLKHLDEALVRKDLD